MIGVITEVSYDKGTISQPAFLDVLVRYTNGTTERVFYKGKHARNRSNWLVGELFDSEGEDNN